MAVQFPPHADGEVACVTFPHQEVFLGVSLDKGLVTALGTYKKGARNFKLTAKNNSRIASWLFGNVAQTTSVLI
jgi:hypothetical protein